MSWSEQPADGVDDALIPAQTDDSVFSSIQAVSGSLYNNAEYNKNILKTFLLRKARQRGIRLPTGSQPDVWNYLGAFVETPTAGMNENVVYCDLASLYPNNILTLNASPETLIGFESDLEASEYTKDDCVWGYADPRPVKHIESGESWRQYTDGQYKMVYDPSAPAVKWTCDSRSESHGAATASQTPTCDEGDGPQYEKLYFLNHDIQKGFLTDCIADLLALKEQYRGTPLYGATKRIVNSVYGFVAFATQHGSSMLYDWRIAEAITLSGRKIIQHSRDTLIDELQSMGYNEAYACSGDTDATAISLPTGSTQDQILRDVREAVEHLNTDGYDTMAQELFNVTPNHREIEIEVESFAPRLFIPSQNPPHDEVGVKKRYIQWETWNDDDGDTDDISITGLEAQRSDVAPITQQAQEWFADTLRMDDQAAKEQLYPQLREYVELIRSGEIATERICKRGGIGQSLYEYGSSSRRPAPLYRGAKYTNEYIDGETIQQGDKPMAVYVDSVGTQLPSTYAATTAEGGDMVDTISVTNAENVPDGVTIDYEKHLTKVLIEPMKPLLATRFGRDPWSEIIHQHEQGALENFM